jgi:hypothetical protein
VVEPVESLEVAVRVPFPVRSVESVRHCALKFRQEQGRVELTLPLDAADIVLLRKPAGRGD